EGVTMHTCEVYASLALPGPEPLRAALAGDAPVIALVHSGEAARRFEELCAQWGIAPARVHLAAIGPRVLKDLKSPWASARTATEPSDAALLALAHQMCQEFTQGSTQADNQT
ncbi:uroporphyrinogen-III synthase, partial [Novosphingobium sp. 1949]|nr:uroporphyrinogen-III synthase [Novosphingobium organovorum]